MNLVATESNKNNTKVLYDVVIVRIFLTILLVLYHSFAPFYLGWSRLEGQPSIKGYFLIGKFAYLFMLETYVFVSGYVYGFQVRQKGEEIVCFNKTIVKKFSRLMIPSMIFSILYMLLFDCQQLTPPLSIFYFGI